MYGRLMFGATALLFASALPSEAQARAGARTAPPIRFQEMDRNNDRVVTRAEWQGSDLIDRNGEKIGKLQDVYVDVETDEPMFGTVKEGLIGRHLTFVPLAALTMGPDGLQVTVSRDQVKSAPNIELRGGELLQADESALYHHYEMNYTPPNTPSGRRLARR